MAKKEKNYFLSWVILICWIMNPILKQMIFLILRFLIICFHIYYNPLGWLTTQLLLLTIYFQITPEHNTLSGSVLSRISDHFPQFLVMTKVNIDYKRCSFAKRDFWNLNEQKFISDFSNINHSFLYDNDKTLNYKFDTFYENLNSYVNHHVPTKKMTKKDLNNKKRSHTQLDSREQVIAFQDRVITINIKEAQHPLKWEKQVIDKSSIMLKISTKSMHRVLVWEIGPANNTTRCSRLSKRRLLHAWDPSQLAINLSIDKSKWQIHVNNKSD